MMKTPLAEKHRPIVEECVARLIARAANARGIGTADLFGRVAAAVEKYVLSDSPNDATAEIRKFADALNADDLCLVAACERGDETAWNDLVKNFDATVKSAARKIAANAEDAEDLASSIWAELYGLKEKSRSAARGKLSYYSGRGSLAGWLRAVVSQLAVDGFRKSARFVQVEEAREFDNLASEAAADTENARVLHAADTPEEVLSRTEARRDLADALRLAVETLDAEDRLIMKLYYFDDLKLKDIGAALGFHEATASRKLARVQTEIRKSVEKNLCERHGWRAEEVKRFLAETASKMDLSVEKMFALLLAALMPAVQEFWR